MGAFFNNMAVRGKYGENILGAYKDGGTGAYVNEADEWTLVFPADDFQIANEGKHFSHELKTLVFVGMIFDSDDFYFYVFNNGELVVEYYYDRMEGKGPGFNTGDMETLAKILKITDIQKLNRILFEDNPEDDYVFIEGRYQDLLKLANLPTVLGNMWGYNYIDSAESDGRGENLKKDFSNLQQA